MDKSAQPERLQKLPERRLLSFYLGVAAAVALVLALILAVVTVLIVPDDAALRQRVSDELESRYRVRVDIRSVTWRLLPFPLVTVRDVHTHQPEAIDIQTIRLRPALWPELFRGEFAIATLEVEGARVPTVALRAFRSQREPTAKIPGIALHQARFRRLTWISRTGVALPLEGEVDFDPDWRPARAEIRRPGIAPTARLVLERDGRGDRWATRVDIGRGSAHGSVALHSREGWLQLTGTLKPQGIDIVTAAQALKRRTAVGGRARGVTSVGARGRTVGELGSSLRLRTEFVVDNAELLRLDLDRAIRTLGAERSGRTALATLTGVMDVQNTGSGTVIRFRDIAATGDTFSATGQGTVFNRQIAASGELRTLGKALVVPFRMSGPTRDVKVTVPTAVKAGAVAGTLVLPILGTVLGARIGAAFSDDSPPSESPPGTPRFKATPLRVSDNAYSQSGR